MPDSSCRCALFTVTFLEIKEHIIHCIRKNQRISHDVVSSEVSISNGSKIAEMQYELSGNVYFLCSQQMCGLSDEFIEKCIDNVEK